jgi:hypothetical protein
MLRHKIAAMSTATALAVFTWGAQAQTASGKFTCDNESNTIESAVAAWVPEGKNFIVWAFASKFSDEELKAFAYAQAASRMKTPPKALSEPAFKKIGDDMRYKKVSNVNYVMIRGELKTAAPKVEWANTDRATLMYVKCLKNENLNFSMRPGEKDAKSDITKAFKSFDFPLKDGAQIKFQTIAFKHDAAPKGKGIDTRTTWDYKVDAKVYVIE